MVMGTDTVVVGSYCVVVGNKIISDFLEPEVVRIVPFGIVE